MAGEMAKLIVDEVSGWLRVYDDGSVDRTWTGPPQVKFLASPYYPSPQEALENDGVVIHDIAIPPPFDVSVRVYLPVIDGEVERKLKLPLLLHFQGGGFCISRPTWYMYYQFYARLATTCGAVVVSVTTRLAPEHRLPAAIEDGYNALLWLRSLAQANHKIKTAVEVDLLGKVDFSRIFLIGDSSGGNLVHEVAARAGEEEQNFFSPLKLAGAIPIHPGVVRSTRSRSESEGKEDPFLTLDMLDKFLALALPLGATKDHPTTCPMGEFATPMGRLNLPPMMLVVADNDLIKDTELEYYEALKKAGKDVEMVVNYGVGHSFYLNKLAVDLDPTVGKATIELIEAIKAFVDLR